jgi:hypothetical protein
MSAGLNRDVMRRSVSSPSVPFVDGSRERCRGLRAYCSPFGPPAHDSHRLRPWLQAILLVPEGLPAGYSGGEIAPEGRGPTENRRRRKSPAALSRVRSGRGPGVSLLGTCRRSRVTPQRVCEDPDGSSGRSHVLDLTRRNPVVDRASAHSDCFTRFHNRKGLAVHITLTGLLVTAVVS